MDDGTTPMPFTDGERQSMKLIRTKTFYKGVTRELTSPRQSNALTYTEGLTLTADGIDLDPDNRCGQGINFCRSIPEPVGGMHPKRRAYCEAHAHPDRGHPISWAKPLANLNVFDRGLDLDLLAARLEADLPTPDQGKEGEG